MKKTLELIDLDGTCNSIDTRNQEVVRYFEEAAIFVSENTWLAKKEILEWILTEVEGLDREAYEHWASFPNAQKGFEKVCPAVDHFLLTPSAIREFLKKKWNKEASEFAAKNDWEYPLYKDCSAKSLEVSRIEEDAVFAISERIKAWALVAIFTNSSTEKAKTMLERAGFWEKISDSIQAGKIWVIWNWKKYEIDRAWKKEGTRFWDEIDLTEVFWEEIKLNLQRKHYHDLVKKAVEETGAGSIWMASDIPELDLYPLKNWGFEVEVAVKSNKTSGEKSLKWAEKILWAKVSDRLSELILN